MPVNRGWSYSAQTGCTCVLLPAEVRSGCPPRRARAHHGECHVRLVPDPHPPVSALLRGPGGDRVSDFMGGGGGSNALWLGTTYDILRQRVAPKGGRSRAERAAAWACASWVLGKRVGVGATRGPLGPFGLGYGAPDVGPGHRISGPIAPHNGKARLRFTMIQHHPNVTSCARRCG